jgi:hypothetical protein
MQAVIDHRGGQNSWRPTQRPLQRRLTEHVGALLLDARHAGQADHPACEGQGDGHPHSGGMAALSLGHGDLAAIACAAMQLMHQF